MKPAIAIPSAAYAGFGGKSGGFNRAFGRGGAADRIRVALGTAVPAIEAWCMCGSDPHVTESAWIQALQSRRFPYTKKDLKQRIYGSPEPALELETRRLVEQTKRILAEDHLALLGKQFPVGFGSLADEVRSWLAQPFTAPRPSATP